MRFEKGNKAASSSSRKAMAEMIRQRLEKEKDSLTSAQFLTLTNRYNALVVKKRRRPRAKPEEMYLGKKVSSFRFFDLVGQAAVDECKMILQIEAEQRQAAQK